MLHVVTVIMLFIKTGANISCFHGLVFFFVCDNCPSIHIDPSSMVHLKRHIIRLIACLQTAEINQRNMSDLLCFFKIF